MLNGALALRVLTLSNQSLHLESLKMQTKLDDFDVCVVTEKMVSDRWFSLIFAQAGEISLLYLPHRLKMKR